jgi:PPM family protein phosphatase
VIAVEIFLAATPARVFSFSEHRPLDCVFVTTLVYNGRGSPGLCFVGGSKASGSILRLPSVPLKRNEEISVDRMNVKSGVEVAGLSDVGCQRDNNEDSYLYWEPLADPDFERKGRLAVIADGMGGYEGGQEASRLAVETVREVYDKVVRDDPRAALLEAFATAHERIQSYAAKHPQFHGMGTTCTALVIRGRKLYFAHVGDSRLYLVRDARIARLTRDHSYVGRLVESGIVRPEDAEKHPQRHILTAALGAGLEVSIESPEQALDLQDSDELLLCTDGLWGVVSDQELEAAVNGATPAECCAALVKLALQRGGPDNITVQVLRILPDI